MSFGEKCLFIHFIYIICSNHFQSVSKQMQNIYSNYVVGCDYEQNCEQLHETIFKYIQSFEEPNKTPCWSNSPLDQFIIRDLFSIKGDLLANTQISLTNIGLYLIITTFLIFIMFTLATNYNLSIPNSWSLSQESIYSTIYSIVVNQINANKGQMFFPFITALFIYILINNLVGMVPYSFAPTSHFILTFSISFTVVIGATILGFYIHSLKFFSLFVPSGCPLGLLPLLVLIEFISYLSRNVSLGLRLAANMKVRIGYSHLC